MWPAPCSCDNPHLLQKDDRVLWHRAWGWGHQKQSTIQPYSQGDFPKLHVHICYRLSKHKNLLNLWSSQKKQLADTQISFACPITQFISFPVCWFTLTGGMSTLPHAAPLLTGTELCLGFCGGWASPYQVWGANLAGISPWWAQAGHQPAFIFLPKARSILPRFSGTAAVFLHKSIQR